MATTQGDSDNSRAKEQETRSVALSDGHRLPLVGFGTSSVVAGEGDSQGDGTGAASARDAIKAAVRAGYRFFDTAELYGNEHLVGAALRECIQEGLVRRDELVVCTKVWNTHHKRAQVVEACRESLARLNMFHVDLYLIHWPIAYHDNGSHPINPTDPRTGKLAYSDTHFTETWLGMQDCKDLGLARSIGLSNFTKAMCDQIFAMKGLRHRPVVNQIECHPYLPQRCLLEYSRRQGMVLTAYCPLGSPGACAAPYQPVLLRDSYVAELAKQHGKTPAQVLIRFQVQRGISAIPKSVRPERIEENIGVFDFELTQTEMDRLMCINRNLRYCTTAAGRKVDDHPLYPFHSTDE